MFEDKERTERLELLLKQEKELSQLIAKHAGKKYGKVHQNQIHRLADKHTKQQIKFIQKWSTRKAKQQIKK